VKFPLRLPVPRKRPSQQPAAAQAYDIMIPPVGLSGVVLEEYDVGDAHVIITDNEGKGNYVVSEPALSEQELSVYSLIMESLRTSLKTSIDIGDPLSFVDEFIWEAAEENGVVDQVKAAYKKYQYYIKRETLGYGPIDVMVRDQFVEEVSCEGFGKPVAVLHKKYTEFDWLDSNVVFPSEDNLRVFVQRFANLAGKSVTVAVPYVDAMMKEGHRIALTYGNEITLPGSSFDIRKFPEEPLSITSLLKYGTISALMAAYYWILIENRAFVLVIGPMSSGKTSMMNALLTMVSPNLKIATIEDTPELNLPHTHRLTLKSRQAYSMVEQRFNIDLMDLTKFSLRVRPDYIVVGEARGEEIKTLFQAGALGHGAVSSFHADSPEAAIVRMSSPPLNVLQAQQMLLWSLLLMQRIKLPNGKLIRRAVRSTEVAPKADGTVELVDLFRWDIRTDTFHPNTPEEVVDLSERFDTVKNLTGWSNSDLVNELNTRTDFLLQMVKNGEFRYDQVAEALGQFYRKKIGR